MCGIFLYSSKDQIKGKKKKYLEKCFQKIKHRGPDQSDIKYYGSNFMMGFHRLAIMDPTNQGIQPFESKDRRFVMMMNGEIYNFRELESLVLKNDNGEKVERSDLLKTHSDCEIVVHLFDHLLRKEVNNETEEELVLKVLKILCSKYLDGEFALTILDQKTQIVYFAVDELSVRPLFHGIRKENSGTVVNWECVLTSEQKSIPDGFKIQRIPSSSYGYIKDYSLNICEYGCLYNIFNKTTETLDISFVQASLTLKDLLIKNVKTKLNPEREFGFLLSGGLDSSLVCSIASKLLYPARIKTFTIGFSEEATDIKAARLVAKHIDSIHHEFICSYQEGIDIVERVVEYGETWDQTSIRASIPMALCIKKAKELYSDMAVIYSGEVADELLMGYLYNLNAPNTQEAREDQFKRLSDIYMFDGLRADRACSSYSIELRLPFFGKELLEFVLSLPTEYITPLTEKEISNECIFKGRTKGIEKFILRYAFSNDNYLPNEILWRTKNAFSDATSHKSEWKEILKSLAEQKVTDSRFKARTQLYPFSTPQTKEDFYYRELFDFYGYDEKCISYKWLPSWSGENITDSSATVLSVFQENKF